MTWETQPQHPVPAGQPPVRPPMVPEQDPLANYQPIAVQSDRKPPRRKARRSSFSCGCGCLSILLLFGLVGLVYFLAPLRTNLLILGVDRTPEGTALGRTDTIIVVSVNPLLPTVRMLSIPRDLWISIPDVGENRINTVHFFAEANQPGSGPRTTVQVIGDTFNIPLRSYVRVQFDGVVQIVDAMGGVDVNMPEAMSGYEAGWHHLNGTEALAFARDRKNADDFFRMAHGQLLIQSIVRQILRPATWLRLPQVSGAVFSMVDTNLPFPVWPRLGLAMVRAVLFDRIESRTFDRQMAAPYITDQGASVLLPNWDLINPVVQEMFR